MKARVTDQWKYVANNSYGLSYKEWNAVKKVATEVVDEMQNDIATRCMMVMCLAMMHKGLKASTINWCIDDYFKNIAPMYTHYKQDKFGDWWVYDQLKEYGLNVNMTEKEQ